MAHVLDQDVVFPGYQLPQELKDIQMKYRKFNQEEILPLEKELDYDAEFLPKDVFDRLVKKTRAEGMWCPEVPKVYGGQGMGSFAMCIINEEWCQHRAGVYKPGYGVYGFPPIEAIWGGTPEQQEKYGQASVREGYTSFWGASEAGPGSDAASCETTAVKEGDHYILNGTKYWVSAAFEAKWGLVTARTSSDKYTGISTFIIDMDMPGVTLIDWPVSRSSVRAPKMKLENVKVPVANLLGGGEGKGFASAMRFFNKSRPYYSSVHVGIAQAANDMASDYSKKRVVFGAPLSEKQAIQAMLVDSEIEIRSARWLVWDAAWKTDRNEDARVETGMAKFYSAEMAGRVVDRAMQIHGGYSITKDPMLYPLERWYREIRFRRIGRGPTEALKFNTVYRYLFEKKV